MAYYGSTTINQGAAGLGQFTGKLQAYADGVVGGPPGGAMPGSLMSFRDGSLGKFFKYPGGASGLGQTNYALPTNLRGLGIVGRNALNIISPPAAMLGLGGLGQAPGPPAFTPGEAPAPAAAYFGVIDDPDATDEQARAACGQLAQERGPTASCAIPRCYALSQGACDELGAPTAPSQPVTADVMPDSMGPPEAITFVPPPSPEPSPLATFGKVLSLVGAAGGAYHGYKRNDSIGWAFGWSIFGGMLPIFAIPVYLAQGFAKPKKAKA